MRPAEERPRGEAMGTRETSTPGDLPLRESFGRQLRSLRLGRSLSIRRLARLARIDASRLSRIEHGQLLPPPPPTIARLAVVLQIDPEDLNALAWRLPEDISSCVFRRPQLMMRLLRAAGPYGDDQLDRICRALERRDLLS